MRVGDYVICRFASAFLQQRFGSNAVRIVLIDEGYVVDDVLDPLPWYYLNYEELTLVWCA